MTVDPRTLAEQIAATEHHARCDTRKGGSCDCYRGERRTYVVADAYLDLHTWAEQAREHVRHHPMCASHDSPRKGKPVACNCGRDALLTSFPGPRCNCAEQGARLQTWGDLATLEPCPVHDGPATTPEERLRVAELEDALATTVEALQSIGCLEHHYCDASALAIDVGKPWGLCKRCEALADPLVQAGLEKKNHGLV